jgi:DNA primase
MNIQASIDAGYTTVMYDFAEDRCVFLIYDDNNNMIGAVGRALRKGVMPKWKRYDKRKDLMFFCGKKQGTAVLVEDCASACTVFASGFTGVALLGTSLNEHHIYQLRVFDKIIVALDADASQKAIRMQKMLAPHVSSELLFLTDDLKYLTPESVRSLLTK